MEQKTNPALKNPQPNGEDKERELPDDQLEQVSGGTLASNAATTSKGTRDKPEAGNEQ